VSPLNKDTHFYMWNLINFVETPECVTEAHVWSPKINIIQLQNFQFVHLSAIL